MNFRKIQFALLAAVVLAAGTATAQSYATAAPKVGKVIVEQTYYFNRSEYAPAVPVITVAQSAVYDTPESVTVAAISAMQTKNVAWFRSLWDKNGQDVLTQRDREQNQTPEFWQQAWERAFAGKRVELTSRIETGDYVIIAYRLVPSDPAAKPIELANAVRKVGTRWFLTQDLAGDPVFLGWRTPDEHIQQVVRPAQQPIAQ